MRLFHLDADSHLNLIITIQSYQSNSKGRGVGMFSQLSGNNNVAEADSDNDNNNGHNTTKITNESNGIIENDDDEGDDGHICLSCSQNDTIVKFTISDDDDDDEYITEAHFVEKHKPQYGTNAQPNPPRRLSA